VIPLDDLPRAVVKCDKSIAIVQELVCRAMATIYIVYKTISGSQAEGVGPVVGNGERMQIDHRLTSFTV